ncbi:MAG: shikimate dehydrogenase [Lacisediminihabitans sp.]
MSEARLQLAVLGSPIGHSLSPALHTAAYGALGLGWDYSAVEVTEGALAGFIASRGTGWRGLSLTMPLKRAVVPLLGSLDEPTELTGGANTVLFDEVQGNRVLRGFNTDVNGVVEAFRDAGVERLDCVRVLGSGATAASVIVAVSRLRARRVDVSARTPTHAVRLQALGVALGVDVRIAALDSSRAHPQPDAVVNTIPGGADVSVVFAESVMTHAILFEVAYDPWPTPLVKSWSAAGGRVISGVEMLLHQALVQVRVFVGGDPDRPLENEGAVLVAMRGSLTPV